MESKFKKKMIAIEDEGDDNDHGRDLRCDDQDRQGLICSLFFPSLFPFLVVVGVWGLVGGLRVLGDSFVGDKGKSNNIGVHTD